MKIWQFYFIKIAQKFGNKKPARLSERAFFIYLFAYNIDYLLHQCAVLA